MTAAPVPEPEISLVIPVYNEQDNLPILAAEIRAARAPLGRPYEVLFVDDGSHDASPAVRAELALAHPALRIIRQRRNSGHSAPRDARFRHAPAPTAVTLS